MELQRSLAARATLAAGPGSLAAVAACFGAVCVAISYATAPAVVPVVIAGATFAALALWRLEYGLAMLLALTVLALPAPASRDARVLLEILSSVPFWLLILAVIQAGRAIIGRRELTLPPISLALSIFLLVALFGFLASPDQSEGALSLFLIAAGLTTFLLAAEFLDLPSQRRSVLVLVLAIGVAVGLHAIWQYETGNLSRIGFQSSSGAVEYRVSSTFVHPNMLAVFLSLMIPVAVCVRRLYTDRAIRWLAAGAVPLALLGILVSYSRGTLVALAALPFVYARGRRALPLLIVAGVIVVLLAPSAWRDRVSGSQDFASPEIASRFDLWEAALQEYDDEPVFGVGLGAYGTAYVDLEESAKGFPPGETTFAVPLHAHSLYLNVLAEQGLIGAASLALLLLAGARLVIALRRSRDETNRLIGQMLLGVSTLLLVQAAFDKVLFRELPTTIATAILMGVGAAALIAERRRAI